MSQGKRGQALENLINFTNEAYKNKGMALINKIPTPWNVHYDKRTHRVIRAFPQEKSTVDFIGISHGRAIAFDAKSTRETTRFPLSNIKPHQIEFLKRHRDQGGISFFIIEFAKFQEVYFMDLDDVLPWWEKAEKGGRKSIPYNWCKRYLYQVGSRNGVPLDYLKFCVPSHKYRKEVYK